MAHPPKTPIVPSPATESPAEVVTRLRATFGTGRTRACAWRMRQLTAFARLLDEQADTLADAIVADLGRDRVSASLLDIVPVMGEIDAAKKNLRSWMRDTKVSTNIATFPGKAWVHHEPLGVALIVAPWNYPVHLALAPLVAAIAAGNCAVIKPSELTPKCSSALAELLPRYLDADAFAVVEGDADETQALLAQAVDLCFFTGSPAVGKHIMAAAAEHLTPVVLELGGKSPAVVTRSANVRLAAKRVAWGKVTNSGQTCVAPDYVLVDREVREEFVRYLRSYLRRFSSHAPLPILSERHAQRLDGLVRSAGCPVAAGGGVDVAAATMHPTVLIDPAPDAPVMQEEIFGPVVPVVSVDDIQGAIAHIARGTRPLAAYLFSSRKAEQKRFVAAVPAGGTVINHVMTHLSLPDLPFGGVGTSGTGKYHGKWGFDAFSNAKAVLRQSTRFDLPLIYPPYRGLKRKIMTKVLG